MNAVSLAGLALVAAGLVLMVLGAVRIARTGRRFVRYRKPKELKEGDSMWAGAVTAAEVYVPGSLPRSVLVLLLGLLVALAGAGVLGLGVELEGTYLAVSRPRLLARVAWRDGTASGETSGGRSFRARLGGRLLVAHGEQLRLKGWLGYLGLGNRVRLTHLSSYASASAVLSRQGLERLELAGPSRVAGLLGWLAPRFPRHLELARRFTLPLEPGDEAELWAKDAELAWSR